MQQCWNSVSNRPIGATSGAPQPIDPTRDGRHCAFCPERYTETPPEKSRLIRTPDGWRSRGLREENLWFDNPPSPQLRAELTE